MVRKNKGDKRLGSLLVASNSCHRYNKHYSRNEKMKIVLASFLFWVFLALVIILQCVYSCASTWDKPQGKIIYNNCTIVNTKADGTVELKCKAEMNEDNQSEDTTNQEGGPL